jgi:hypothetical protein
MRKATTIVAIKKTTMVEVEGVGTMRQIDFFQTLYSAGRIDYEKVFKSRKNNYTSEFVTRLLNENADLFPADF